MTAYGITNVLFATWSYETRAVTFNAASRARVPQRDTHLYKVLSYYAANYEQEECREQLCNCGALPALIQLASMEDEATKLRCVIAFANLSCEYTIRGQMVRMRHKRGRQVNNDRVLTFPLPATFSGNHILPESSMVTLVCCGW